MCIKEELLIIQEVLLVYPLKLEMKNLINFSQAIFLHNHIIKQMDYQFQKIFQKFLLDYH